MTTAVRKTDEELKDKRKCMISGLMTDLGLIPFAMKIDSGLILPYHTVAPIEAGSPKANYR